MIVNITDFGFATTKLGFLWMEPSVSINKSNGQTVPSISMYADKQLRVKSYLTEKERNDALVSIEKLLDDNKVPCDLIPGTGVYINGFNLLSVTKRFEGRPGFPNKYQILIEFTQLSEKVLSFGSEKARDDAYQAILSIAEKAGEGGNYDSLDNLPSLNGNVIKGDLTSEDLGIPTKTSELENDADFVPYHKDGDRKFIVLDNHNGLSGVMTDGRQPNLAMVSKWDVADFGSPMLSANINTKDKVTINDDEVIATDKDLEEATKNVVRYKDFGTDRKTIELRNYDSISGLAKDGTGYNLAMLSKWDVADFGATGVHLNLNTKDNVTINDKDIVATTENLKEATDSINEELALKADKVNTYTKTEIDDIIKAINQFQVKVVDVLPETGEELIIYLVPKDSSLQEDDNVYDEYIWSQGKWEHIGDTKIDLSDYVTNSQLANELAKKQNNLVPSENIILNDSNIDVNAQRVVLYSLWDNRKFIQLANHDALSGVTTEGEGVNLAMVSKWDVADFGSNKIHFNINTKDNATINDTDVIATDKDLALKEDKALFVQIPLRTLQDKVYDQETILGWFNVEDVAALKSKIATNSVIFIKWGISLSGQPKYYRFVPEYFAFETDNQIKLVFNGLDTSNDENCKYEAIINLDGTIIEGSNSNVSLKMISTEVKELDAQNVSYINGSFTNVKEALDELLYVEPKVTSFTGGGTYEMGQTIASVSLKWALNKTVTSQSLNNGIGSLDANLREYQVADANLTSDTTYTITVNDGKKSASANTSVLFRQKRYWGVSAEESLTNEQVLALSQEFSTTRKQSRTFDCSGGKYFYFVIPTQYCNGIQFKVGGLSFSAMESSTIQLTNASGYASSYNVYRCSNIQTGSAINVEVL